MVKKWTKEEVEHLKYHYPRIPAWMIGKTLGRTAGAVSQKAFTLDLKALPRRLPFRRLPPGTEYSP